MTPTDFRQTDKFKKGHTGELIVARLLKQQDWYIIPSYDYSGAEDNKAPRLQGLDKEYIIPDLDISQKGCRLWAEIKTKASPSYTRITKRLEHGIPLRHRNHYLKIQEITGCDVWLYIVEEDTGTVLRAALNELIKCERIYSGDLMSYGGMAFFPRDAFEVWATADESGTSLKEREAVYESAS